MGSKDYVIEKMKAIGLRAAEELQKEAPGMDGTQLIGREGDIPDFDPDKHQYLDWKTGTCTRDGGQVWKLLQPYDSTIYKDPPAQMRAQWGLCHTKDPQKAKPYVAPEGTSGLYMEGECCIAGDGKVYRSKADNNAWPPDGCPEGWEGLQQGN